MTLFNLAGTLSSIMFVLCLGGLLDQIAAIVRLRRRDAGPVTGVLSLNQFLSSYLSFYSFFVYSYLLADINAFLFVTRLAACVLTASLILLIARDRKSRSSMLAAAGVLASILVSAALYALRDEIRSIARNGIEVVIVASSVLLLQGGVHQIGLIRGKRSVGALSLRMTAVFFLKDLSNVLFGVTMGWADGWPLMLIGSVSGATKAGVLYHFRWVKSPKAA